jgi:probable HAF family extracellular repeat protein
LIPKHERRFTGFDEKIIAMYARGMAVREVQGYLLEMYGVEVSPEFISSVTDAIMAEVSAWQARALEPLYPVVFFDALRVKIGEEAVVRNKAIYLETQGGLESPFHAFITDANSAMTDLGTLGGENSQALDINSNEIVVGSADTAIGRQHAFITGPNGNGMVDLNTLVKLENGTFLTDATGVNDRGQVIANANDGGAYLLSPVPEPETYVMFLAGLGLIGFIARLKRRAS